MSRKRPCISPPTARATSPEPYCRSTAGRSRGRRSDPRSARDDCCRRHQVTLACAETCTRVRVCGVSCAWCQCRGVRGGGAGVPRTILNQSLDLMTSIGLTSRMTTTAGRTVRTERASSTQEAILVAAERLYAEHGMFAVSNRQVSEAAGQGNNAAVGYHFGTKADLVRAIEQKHRGPVEQLREQMVADLLDSGSRNGHATDMRDWVACLVRPLTDHLADLGCDGSPTWYARFAAQAMT